jgi:hypothetical protein
VEDVVAGVMIDMFVRYVGVLESRFLVKVLDAML